MTAKHKILILWSVLLVANLYELVADIINNRSLPIYIVDVVGVLACVWLVWDGYRDYKVEKESIKTMHNVFITINNADADAKEAAGKAAAELYHKLNTK
jgi:hypothetical protein